MALGADSADPAVGRPDVGRGRLTARNGHGTDVAAIRDHRKAVAARQRRGLDGANVSCGLDARSRRQGAARNKQRFDIAQHGHRRDLGVERIAARAKHAVSAETGQYIAAQVAIDPDTLARLLSSRAVGVHAHAACVRRHVARQVAVYVNRNEVVASADRRGCCHVTKDDDTVRRAAWRNRPTKNIPVNSDVPRETARDGQLTQVSIDNDVARQVPNVETSFEVRAYGIPGGIAEVGCCSALVVADLDQVGDGTTATRLVDRQNGRSLHVDHADRASRILPGYVDARIDDRVQSAHS